MTTSHKSFASLAAEINRRDVQAAEKLRKSAALANKKPGTGPRIAR